MAKARKRHSKKKFIIIGICIFAIAVSPIAMYVANVLLMLKKYKTDSFTMIGKLSFGTAIHNALTLSDHMLYALFVDLFLTAMFILIYWGTRRPKLGGNSELNEYGLPAAVGHGEFGVATLQTIDEKYETTYAWGNNNSTFKSGGGIIYGKDEAEQKERDVTDANGNPVEVLNELIFMDTDDVHTLIIGTTRSGKTRRLILPMLHELALSGESIILTDPKGELFIYAYPFLKSLGIDVVCMNFRTPSKSRYWNPLQAVIDELDDRDREEFDRLTAAEEASKDISTIIVNQAGRSSDRAEPIWTEGAISVISALIMLVCNRDEETDQGIYNDFLSRITHIIAVRNITYNDYGGITLEADTENEEGGDRTITLNLFEKYTDYKLFDIHFHLLKKDSVKEPFIEVEIVNDGEEKPDFNVVLVVSSDYEIPSKRGKLGGVSPLLPTKHLSSVYSILMELGPEDAFGNVPLNQLMAALDTSDPAKRNYAAAGVAGDKTRTSFYAEVLARLSVFASLNIGYITSQQDHCFVDVVKKQTAVFLVIPDNVAKYDMVATLYISQQYNALIKYAGTLGNRLPRRVNMLLDEWGNMPCIDNFTKMLTVGGGYGIRFILAVQSMNQIKKAYKDDYETITSNCHNWIYLKASDNTTAEEVSKKCGTYTIETSSTGASFGGGNSNASSNSGIQLSKRELLMPYELMKMPSDKVVVTRIGFDPAIYYLPDLIHWKANKALGMGNKPYNVQLAQDREKAITAHTFYNVLTYVPKPKKERRKQADNSFH